MQMIQFEVITKEDVEEIVGRIVGTVVAEIVGDAMKLIDERFKKVEARLNRIESILESHTILLLDHGKFHQQHSSNIKTLQLVTDNQELRLKVLEMKQA